MSQSETVKAFGELPAYPCEGVEDGYSGLSIREAFAMAAMQGLCANGAWLEEATEKAKSNPVVLAKTTAFIARHMADALLEEMAKEVK
jgi:hypothetical protein